GGCVLNNNKDCLAGFYGRLDRRGAQGLWKRDLALAIAIAIVIGIAGMAISARAQQPLRVAVTGPQGVAARDERQAKKRFILVTRMFQLQITNRCSKSWC
ncbi:MAG TPA: hypothetical protein VFM10_05620, partial [Terriglobales bacterium]|nr:hypothetical protein [Terriglobales bacterium]